jgi:FKBP-type peptidyl-prolyl cis-trans isomerase FkpA
MLQHGWEYFKGAEMLKQVTFRGIMLGAILAAGVLTSFAQATKVDTSKPSPVSGPAMKTKSGVNYWDIKVGTGATAMKGNTVTVHYTGWLTNGKKFDSSVDRNEPFQFQLESGVIQGWIDGVQGMKVGGKRQLKIPPELGYGAQGAPGAIPPNATLIFDVELLSIDRK